MFSFVNRTVFDIPLTWDRTRFESARSKYRHARKLIENSVNVQFEKQLKNVSLQNKNIEKNIMETNEHLLKHEKKVEIFNNLTEIASESLSDFFDKRMEIARASIQEHCNAIQKILQQENEYWKKIHTAIDQNLITSNDIHPSVQNTSNDIHSSVQTSSDNSPILVEVSYPSSAENFAPTKSERVSIVLPRITSNLIHPSGNTTYATNLEETTNKSSTDIETSLLYSQPNPPARLYLSPIILQDERSASFRNILSPLDQNQTNFPKPIVILQRISQAVLLNHLKTEENNNNHTPLKLSNDSIQSESNNHYQNCFVIPELIPKPATIRKRKQSVSEEIDTKSYPLALRKRRAVSIVEIEVTKPKEKATKRRKAKIANENQTQIREPSPLPTIDRSKRYPTSFSSRTRRIAIDTDDGNYKPANPVQIPRKTINTRRNKKR